MRRTGDEVGTCPAEPRAARGTLVGVTVPLLVARLHVDLQRVSSAACPPLR